MSLKHLVVPLDGSRLAEAVLPTAASLAHSLGGSITLLHMIERNPPQEIHGERHLTSQEEALEYLKQVAQRSFPPDLNVDFHVHTTEIDNVARSIVEHASELDSDLIAMCTHGRSGLRNWLFGNIAQQVLAIGATPVVLVNPEMENNTPHFQCKRLLLPLDGNPDHEQCLQPALMLAGACKAEIKMVMVVPTYATLPGEQAAAAQLLPSATSAMLDLRVQNAEEYLRSLKSRLENQQAKVFMQVERGDAVKGIVKTARKWHADLIVLSTHGKSSQDAFWSGSITPRVLAQSRIPLMLVPIRAAAKLN